MAVAAIVVVALVEKVLHYNYYYVLRHQWSSDMPGRTLQLYMCSASGKYSKLLDISRAYAPAQHFHGVQDRHVLRHQWSSDMPGRTL